jgi:hypothetical protein
MTRGDCLKDQFKLSKHPDFHHEDSRTLGRDALVFTGSEILALARFCYTRGAQQPILVAVCERGEGEFPHIYEGCKIDSLSLSDDGASINFHGSATAPHFSLHLVPGKTFDPSGTVISRIETLGRYFPFEEYASFRKTLQQNKSSPRPRN